MVHGGQAIFSAVEMLTSKAVETYGHLDCAHNNAGILGRGIAGTQRALTAEYPDERWHQVIAINLTGVWLCLKYEIQQMLQQGGGTIVDTASGTGSVGHPGHAAYAASKHGVIGLAKQRHWSMRGKESVSIVCVQGISKPRDGTWDARP